MSWAELGKIEDISKFLISGSEDEIFCDEHHRHYQKILMEKNFKSCVLCSSEKHNFEGCPSHTLDYSSSENCRNCAEQKLLVKEFQTRVTIKLLQSTCCY